MKSLTFTEINNWLLFLTLLIYKLFIKSVMQAYSMGGQRKEEDKQGFHENFKSY